MTVPICGTTPGGRCSTAERPLPRADRAWPCRSRRGRRQADGDARVHDELGVVSPPSIEAAALIADLAPGDRARVLRESGSEAVESAAKLAANYHVARGDEGRYKVISREWAYHGTTLARALDHRGAAPALRPSSRCSGTACGTCRTRCTGVWSACERSRRRSSRRAPTRSRWSSRSRRERTRPVLVPPDGYWPELRRICDKYGVLLCADEVINGFGR